MDQSLRQNESSIAAMLQRRNASKFNPVQARHVPAPEVEDGGIDTDVDLLIDRLHDDPRSAATTPWQLSAPRSAPDDDDPSQHPRNTTRVIDGRPDRQRDGVVRLRGVWLFRHGDRTAVFPLVQSDRLTDWSLRRLCRRLSETFGVLFGRIGDRVGRRKALQLSVLAMAIPTVLMGLLPTHRQIGIAAPIIVVLLRLIQGVSVGGEYTSSVIFPTEQAPDRKRGFFAIWGLGIGGRDAVRSGIGDLPAHILSPEQLQQWGWRIPFLFGALVALTGVLLRRGIGADVIESTSKAPIRETFGRYRLQVLRVMALNIGSSVGYYAAFVYAVSYLEDMDHFSRSSSLSLNTGVMAVLLVLFPIAAWLSDRDRPQADADHRCILTCFGALPFFGLLHSGDPQQVLCGELA